MPRQTFSEFSALFRFPSPSAPAFPVSWRGILVAQAFGPSDTVFSQWSKYIWHIFKIKFLFLFGWLLFILVIQRIHLLSFFLCAKKCNLCTSRCVRGPLHHCWSPGYIRTMALLRACITPDHVVMLKCMYSICWSITGKWKVCPSHKSFQIHSSPLMTPKILFLHLSILIQLSKALCLSFHFKCIQQDLFTVKFC